LRGRIAELRGEQAGEIPEFPEPFTPESELVEAVESQISDHISAGEEKTVDEIFNEADIFIRYGLLFEAEKILEGLKLKAPENIDLHLRLKSVYSEIKDKDSAVTECLILSELNKRTGDSVNSQKMLREAYEISPADPRLQERKAADFLELTAFPSRPLKN
jgi:Tfp pilus assembly protein FimV